MEKHIYKSVQHSHIGACLFFMLLLVLCSPAYTPAADYVIGEGDVLTISVWGEKELSQTVKVRPDGKITLPALGEITATDMTPKKLQAELTDKMRGIVKNPAVTVIVSEVTNNKVYVFGGGINSSVYSLTQRTTLLQLLCQIGQQRPSQGASAAASPRTGVQGDSQIADLRKAYVIRNAQKVKENFYDLFINGKMSDDFVIEPNDAIFIPSFRDKNVYVMGAVTTPKSIAYRDGLSVVEALLEAGGFTKFANQNNTVIYRKNEKDETKDIVISVRVKDLISNGDLHQNTRLLPGDYVIVHESLF